MGMEEVADNPVLSWALLPAAGQLLTRVVIETQQADADAEAPATDES